MTSYKLYYFDILGRAEPARWLFALAGVEFEDVRIKHKDWEEGYREGLNPPFGQLPYLEITDDSGTWRLAQSNSIQRYLAEKFGLLGKCSKDVALADSYVEHLTDTVMLLPWNEKDEEKKVHL